ncbi:hypothetical protein HHI36_016685 [Cryptolaemus montrouzieri]|uniref:Uncharacterized protein n=1 Tax=Cryptolaemus montrouzieri TaxID=559131 RepID=A0ABD2NKE1_9CUCU
MGGSSSKEGKIIIAQAGNSGGITDKVTQNENVTTTEVMVFLIIAIFVMGVIRYMRKRMRKALGKKIKMGVTSSRSEGDADAAKFSTATNGQIAINSFENGIRDTGLRTTKKSRSYSKLSDAIVAAQDEANTEISMDGVDSIKIKIISTLVDHSIKEVINKIIVIKVTTDDIRSKMSIEELFQILSTIQ